MMHRSLTSLEYTALGILSKRGPCRAHAVLREFAGSQTFAYRSGAGTVYPLLQRLARAGLLKVEAKRYSLSAQGQNALREWLRPPLPSADISTNLDLIRSRAYFLRLLTPSERREFVAHCRERLQELQAQCEADRMAFRERGDPFSELAMAGAVYETQARLDWLAEVERELARLAAL